ncbi:MAG: DUF6173 family protein [Paracoccaceae bacterium]
MAEDPVTDMIQTSAEVMEAAALPQARVARACDELADTAELEPLPESIGRQPLAEKSPAQWAYERIILYIQNFEKQLDNTQEVAMGFAGGDAGVITIEGIGFFDPDVLTFYGRGEDGTRTQMIQHVSQLNVMLRAMPKSPQLEEPRRIGFRLASDLGPKKKKKG